MQQVAERGGEQDRAHEAAQPGDHGAGGHHRAGGEDLLRCSVRSSGSRSVGSLAATRGGRADPAEQSHRDRAEQQRDPGAEDQPDHVADLGGADRQLSLDAERVPVARRSPSASTLWTPSLRVCASSSTVARPPRADVDRRRAR